MQFSLRTLFGWLGFSAIFCVAMLNAGPAWVMVLRTVALGSLLFALLAIWYRRADQRAFWVGYVHGGGAYALLTLYALGAFTDKPVWNDDRIASGEIATAVYYRLPEGKRRAEIDRHWAGNGLQYRIRVATAGPLNGPAPTDFRYIFHAATIVLCGWIGGLVGVWLYRTRDASNAAGSAENSKTRPAVAPPQRSPGIPGDAVAPQANIPRGDADVL